MRPRRTWRLVLTGTCWRLSVTTGRRRRSVTIEHSQPKRAAKGARGLSLCGIFGLPAVVVPGPARPCVRGLCTRNCAERVRAEAFPLTCTVSIRRRPPRSPESRACCFLGHQGSPQDVGTFGHILVRHGDRPRNGEHAGLREGPGHHPERAVGRGLSRQGRQEAGAGRGRGRQADAGPHARHASRRSGRCATA